MPDYEMISSNPQSNSQKTDGSPGLRASSLTLMASSALAFHAGSTTLNVDSNIHSFCCFKDSNCLEKSCLTKYQSKMKHLLTDHNVTTPLDLINI